MLFLCFDLFSIHQEFLKCLTALLSSLLFLTLGKVSWAPHFTTLVRLEIAILGMPLSATLTSDLKNYIYLYIHILYES